MKNSILEAYKAKQLDEARVTMFSINQLMEFTKLIYNLNVKQLVQIINSTTDFEFSDKDIKSIATKPLYFAASKGKPEIVATVFVRWREPMEGLEDGNVFINFDGDETYASMA